MEEQNQERVGGYINESCKKETDSNTMSLLIKEANKLMKDVTK